MMYLSPRRYGVKGVAPIGSTRSLLNFNGIDNTTVFTDETGKIWAGFGGAVLDNNSAPKYGSAYLKLNGSSSYISTPHNSELNLSNTDFTIECWFNYGGFFQTQYICVKDYLSGAMQYGIRVNNSNKLIGIIGNSSLITEQTVAGATNIPVGWNHVAFVKTAGNIKIYLNGIQDGTAVVGITMLDTGGSLQIGVDDTGATNYFNGGIDDFRISGEAIYTANFTPPTMELTL